MTYQIERSIRRMHYEDFNSKIVWIVDCNGFSYKNVDMKVTNFQLHDNHQLARNGCFTFRDKSLP
jgi:hypothetical protein